MAVRPGDAAPVPDQIETVRGLVEAPGGQLSFRDDGTIVVVFTVKQHAMCAATCALELHDVLPLTRIALATGAIESGAGGTAPIAARGVAMLAEGTTAIRLDDETAMAVEPRFELDLAGSRIVLAEPLATGTPARTNKTIGNYRIVRLLGTGGMGVVYLAEHVSLGRKAVIKFVQDRLSSTSEYVARFFTEAKTAASIKHPGIVDVFDFGNDDAGHGYIVMEFLEGESLRARLKREKPLPVDLAIALGIQIASALAAAHAAGVIHRDLKPDNLFLVPDSEAAVRLRAKVLDFGLAKVTAAPPDSGVTQTGDFVGTPLYMSPEQCRSNAEVNHRTDIYSLGCILFEMVCGQPPFVDKTVGDLIIAHNTTPPPRPRSLVIAIPPALEQVILRALAKAPDDRYATMEELGAALGRVMQATTSGDAFSETVTARAEPAPRTRRRWPAIAIAVAVAAAAAVPIAWFWHRSATTSRSTVRAGSGSHRAIAVIDLRDTSGRAGSAWLATALGEVLATGLASGGELVVIPAEDVARMKVDLGLGAGEWTPERLARVRETLGVDYAIAGNYAALGDRSGGQLRLDITLYDTATGQVVAQASDHGIETDLFAIGSRVDAVIMQELGVAAQPAVAAGAQGPLPKDPKAARLYAEGLAKVRGFELVAGRDLLVTAAGEAPDDPLIHAALAGVWSELGYDGKAGSEAKLAFDHSAGLPREQRLAIEARYRETTGQWDQAIAGYRTLFEFFPTRLDYGLALATAQTRSGDAKSAYATLDALRKLPPPLGLDPRIELSEALAAESADDTERERVHAERAATLARKSNARMLLAKALFRQGWAEWTLGRDADATAHYTEARTIFTEVGDRSGLARDLNNIALAQHRSHHDADAVKTFEEALKIARDIGDTLAQAWVLNNLAYLYVDAGQLSEGLKLYQQKLQLGAERGVPPGSQALAHANIAEILRWQGDLAGARKECETAEGLLRGLDARRYAAWAAYQLGEVLRAADDLSGSRKRLEQALGWASDTMTPAEAAEIRISLARTELAARRANEAEAAARAALDNLRSAKAGSQQVCAIAVLAEALLARDRGADANRELAATQKLPAEGVSYACRLEADLVGARAAADRAALSQVLARGQHAGFVEMQWETRIALARLSGAAADLQAVAREASAKGYQLVARHARER
jgi:tetratricopeptide (TPR) repeat protein